MSSYYSFSGFLFSNITRRSLFLMCFLDFLHDVFDLLLKFLAAFFSYLFVIYGNGVICSSYSVASFIISSCSILSWILVLIYGKDRKSLPFFIYPRAPVAWLLKYMFYSAKFWFIYLSAFVLSPIFLTLTSSALTLLVDLNGELESG